MLTMELTHDILQKGLTPASETQGFACATQSFDTTHLTVSTKVSDTVYLCQSMIGRALGPGYWRKTQRT